MQILLLDTETSWRGGENQMRLLAEGLTSRTISCHYALEVKGEAYRRLHQTLPTIGTAMNGANALFASFRIAQYVRQNGITHLDAQSSRAHGIGLMVKYLCPQLKLIIHRRVDNAPKKSWPNPWKYQSQKIATYVAISQAIGQILLDYGISPAKLTVVRSAVAPLRRTLSRNEARQSLQQELNLNPKALWFLSVAYLTDQKGHDFLLNGFKKALMKTSQPLHLLLAGDGERAADLKALVRQLELDSHVTFLGVRTDISKLLTAADVYIMTSKNEGLGTSFLDASYFSLPLIGTGVGGIPEIITNGENGFLVDYNHQEQLAQAILNLAQQADLRLSLGRQALLKVQKDFSLDAMVEGNLAVYRRV